MRRDSKDGGAGKDDRDGGDGEMEGMVRMVRMVGMVKMVGMVITVRRLLLLLRQLKNVLPLKVPESVSQKRKYLITLMKVKTRVSLRMKVIKILVPSMIVKVTKTWSWPSRDCARNLVKRRLRNS